MCAYVDISSEEDENYIKKLFWGESQWNLPNWHSIHPSDTHTVLYNLPINMNTDSPPKPQRGHNKWDTDHVRLPCSIKSQYPVEKANGETTIETRWELIQTALLNNIYTVCDLEKAILSYNTKYAKIWKFTALYKLFEDELEQEECTNFFEIILPKIIQLALQLPDLIPNSIPLLKQGQNKSISLSQQQVACLLANAFLCTFPRRNTKKKNSEYCTFPDINFSRLFQAPAEPKVLEKLKCICNYFRRVCTTMPKGVITISRRHLSDELFPDWNICDKKFNSIPIHVSVDGTIEETGLGMLQVDFANKFIGGGVLRSGSVQEEIRFVICPELIVTRLFVEYLKPNEAIFIIGCEQFNKYNGYASTFEWSGDYIDNTPFDSSGRRKTQIVAIDALRFIHAHHQFREELMLRELKKSYVGFCHYLNTPAPPVASGNWGCGAFKGSTHLKALLQLMVCVVTKRPLMYFTFGDKELQSSIYEMYNFLCKNNITVKEVWKNLKIFHKHSSSQLYPFLYEKLSPANQIPSTSSNIKSTGSPNKSIPHKISKETLSQSIRDAFKKHQETITLDCSSSNESKNIKESNNERPSVSSDEIPIRKSLLESLDEVYNIKKSKETKMIEIKEKQNDFVVINFDEKMENDTEPQKMDEDDGSNEDDMNECIPASPENSLKIRRFGLNTSSGEKTTPRQRNIKEFFSKK